MPTRAKSRNDTKKEAAEEQCFKLALDAARRRGGGTYKIMSYKCNCNSNREYKESTEEPKCDDIQIRRNRQMQ